MAGLSNVFGSNVAEGANRVPSASRACDRSSVQVESDCDLSAFGYLEKLRNLRNENPEAPIDGYILFGSHTDALALFDFARSAGHSVRISPTPRLARACCGISLLVDCDEVMAVYEVAKEKGIPVENMVALPRQINAKRDRYC